MKVQDITDRRIRPQKLSGAETPHATIEPNTTCNIRCRACYSIEEPEEKPLQQVFDEIDLAMSKRNLDAISLLGGEPSLHPDIVEIVRYVKSRGLVCMLLTNGVRFLYHDDEPLLDALVAAGVDRFLLHIDSGQAHIHDDIEQARERMFSMLDERRVFYGLSLTLYPGEETALPGIMRRYAPHPYFDGVLVTLAMDFKRAFQPASVRRGEPDMGKVV
ncbi:MAG: radical SAM protein, partial [Deltaproteobacteria bacterium]|nr:radical SAM protein [Deltaproteobacteria bacterium]